MRSSWCWWHYYNTCLESEWSLRAADWRFSASFSTMPRSSIPEDKINLRLIMVSGKTKDYLFKPSDSAGDIAQFIFDNWPEDWSDEAVSNAEILRLIYQGRFLHCNVTLSALGLATGKTTVMHLVPRENLPEPNSQGSYSIRHNTSFVM